MKDLVKVEVSGKILDSRFANRVHVFLNFTQPFDVAFVAQSFCRESSDSSFKEPTHFNAVPDVLERKLPDDKTAGRVRFQQAFVRKPLQREPDGRARHADPARQRLFGDALSRTELAFQNHLPQAQNGPAELRLAF